MVKEIDYKTSGNLASVIRKINELIRDYNKKVGNEDGS